MEIILFILIFFFSVIGLSDLIHCTWISIIKPKEKCKKVLICYLSGEFSDLQLKLAFEEFFWYGGNYADELVAVDYNIDESVLSYCIEYARENNIKFVTKEQLPNTKVTEF